MSAIRLNYNLLWETEEGNALSRQAITDELFKEMGPDDWIELNGIKCNTSQELEQAFKQISDDNAKFISSISNHYEDMMKRWNTDK